MAQESFLTDIIALNRVTIKKEVMEVLKLKEGDRVRITIEKVR
jgi:bifunctional DNA-binding transcriptional regulator/antitoxin component of YhaV-PrlF toxin-antitoxin module